MQMGPGLSQERDPQMARRKIGKSVKRQLLGVPLDCILPPARTEVPIEEGQVKELAESIKEEGLLVPLPVRQEQHDPPQYRLLSGGLRLAALRYLRATDQEWFGTHFEQIKVAVDVRPVDIAHAVLQLDRLGMKQIDIAGELDVTQSYVSQLLKIYRDGIEPLRAAFEAGRIKVEDAVGIARNPSSCQRALLDALGADPA